MVHPGFFVKGAPLRVTPFTLIDLFVRQPAAPAGNLDVQKFQCLAVSCTEMGGASSILELPGGPKYLSYRVMEEVSPGVG